MFPSPARLAFSVLLLALASGPASACDVDADCGVGGTCIKREKRARGVCYGGSRDMPTTADEMAVPAAEPPAALDVLGNPEELIRQQLPGKAIGGPCMVTQDCPAGQECVSTGLEGRCVTF